MPRKSCLPIYHTWLGKCLNVPCRSMFTALVVIDKREMDAKSGSVLPTVASKKGILYHSLVKRSNTSAFHADDTGSNPVGVTMPS